MKKTLLIIIGAILALLALTVLLYVVIPIDLLPLIPVDDILLIVSGCIIMVPATIVIVKCWKKLLSNELTPEDKEDLQQVLHNTANALKNLSAKDTETNKKPESLPAGETIVQISEELEPERNT